MRGDLGVRLATQTAYYRDVGGVRIWANNFNIQGDQTVATGPDTLGSAGQNTKYYQVSGTASWSYADLHLVFRPGRRP